MPDNAGRVTCEPLKASANRLALAPLPLGKKTVVVPTVVRRQLPVEATDQPARRT